MRKARLVLDTARHWEVVVVAATPEADTLLVCPQCGGGLLAAPSSPCGDGRHLPSFPGLTVQTVHDHLFCTACGAEVQVYSVYMAGEPGHLSGTVTTKE